MTYEQVAQLFAQFKRASTWPSAKPQYIYFDRGRKVTGWVASTDISDTTAKYYKVPFVEVQQHIELTGETNSENVFYKLRQSRTGSVAVAPPVVRKSVAVTPPALRTSIQRTTGEYPKRIIIDDAFIRAWEPRYDRIASDEPEYRRLVMAVARDVASTRTLSKATFLAIWRWKGAMRVIRFVNMAEYDTRYARAFCHAVSAPPQRRLYLLLEATVKLPGVEAATGSTLLHFMDPETMPIIDVRTIGVLFAAGLISTTNKDLEHYEEFRQAMIGIRSRCPSWSLREIDRALFAYHTEVLDKGRRSTRCGG